MHAISLLTTGLSSHAHSTADTELIQTINAAAQAMSALLDALLDISRLDAGEFEVHISDFPANELLDKLRDSVSAIARDRGLTLRIVPSAHWLRSDPILLQRIILNLVSNALRYTHEGSVLIGCRLRGDQVRIEVRDSGIGIPSEAHAVIFEEFVQLANPERDRSKGLGLGLAIVQRLSKLLDHRITLRSSPGRGSVFAVDVALGTPHATRRDGGAVDRRRAVPMNDRVVLIIEDDSSSRAGMVALISGWGCRVLAGPTTDAALALCLETNLRPEAIISDFRLAENRNGIQAIERVRRHFGIEIPAALVTGDTAADVATLARDAGLVMLTKPTPPAHIRAVLNRLLAQ